MIQAITQPRGQSTLSRSPNRLILIEFSMVLVLVLIAPSVQAQQQVGYVQDINGRWLLNNSRPLRVGQALPSGGVISNPSPLESDHIAIADLHGDIIATRSCKAPANCSVPITLARRSSKGPSDYLAVVVGGVMSLFGVEPDKYIVPSQRGPELSEGVARLEGNQLDLNPIFKGWDKDRYYLQFRLLSGQGAASGSKPLEPIVFDWDPSKPSAVSAAGLKPGLYELTLLKRLDGQYRGTSVSTWIFVSGPFEFAKAEEAFQRMVALATKWGEDVTPEAKQGFLRATLDYLSSQKSK